MNACADLQSFILFFRTTTVLDSILKGRCSVYSFIFYGCNNKHHSAIESLTVSNIVALCNLWFCNCTCVAHIAHTHVFVITIFHENCHIDAERGGRAAISLTETHLRRFQRLASQHASERFVKIKRCGCWGYHRSLLFFWKITDSRWLTLQ